MPTLTLARRPALSAAEQYGNPNTELGIKCPVTGGAFPYFPDLDERALPERHCTFEIAVLHI